MHDQLPIGIVVIGRNESKRLADCLGSLPAALPKVYVDSGSTDDSCHIAAKAGIAILELSPQKPFSAARGRNNGWRYLFKNYPELKAIQFVDGDTVLDAHWIQNAWVFLESHSNAAAVYGLLAERDPGGSIYNQLCELEWKGRPGEVKALLGMSLIQKEALELVGGYRVQLVAGEDPELAIRFRAAGYSLYRLDILMGVHDADQHLFSEWWKRSKRYGYSVAETYALHRGHPLARVGSELTSICIWGLLPTLTLLLSPWLGLYMFIPLALEIIQLLRIAKCRSIHHQDTYPESLLYAFFCLIGKIPQLQGVLRFYLQK